MVDAVLGRPIVLPEPPASTQPVTTTATASGPRIGEASEDGTFGLVFSDFNGTAAVFEDMGYDGGGYGWHGVVDALVRMKAPKILKKLRYDPEASELVVLSKDRNAIEQVAELIREAARDRELLRTAIGKADPELMEG